MLWYLSFVKDGKFAGGVIVEAADFPGAIQETWRQKCNPGGEIKGAAFPDDVAMLTGQKWKNRLLSKEDVDSFDKEIGTLMGVS